MTPLSRMITELDQVETHEEWAELRAFARFTDREDLWWAALKEVKQREYQRNIEDDIFIQSLEDKAKDKREVI